MIFFDKQFTIGKDFTSGIFSIGCCCSHPITYGWELLLSPESPRNFFKFLMNRRVDFRRLQGVIYDHACGLHRYVLNREPLQFNNIRFLVHGSHWSSQKRFKKQDKSRGRHLGCGSGYNWNVYKPFTSVEVGAPNSQSQEQMHARLDKCRKSFCLKNYKKYLRYMNTIFCINNLIMQNKLQNKFKTLPFQYNIVLLKMSQFIDW